MDRRNFLTGALASGAVVSLARERTRAVADGAWAAGSVRHILPTVNHERFLIKVSFASPQTTPRLGVGRQSVAGLPTDTEGEFWAFDVAGLEPDSQYKLTLTNDEGRPLCDSWTLATFPHPDAERRQLRLLVYTCAGGHDAIGSPGKTTFVPTRDRQRLLRRGLSFEPDAVVSIGDHVYWDLRAGKSAGRLGGSDRAIRFAGQFDRDQPVLGTRNEGVLKKAVGPQIAALYGTHFRSTPVFFYQDDHDYFENDHADDRIVTFPPDPFMLALGRSSQWLYYPEFLPDSNRPVGLAASSAGDRPRGISECYGTLRYGRLLEALMYDCVRFLSLKGTSATFVEPRAERWLLERMAHSQARHVVNMPSTPVGWTAGKWAEWYPDVLDGTKLTRKTAKPYWQPGWREQHNRLLAAASAMDRLPLFISGDIHSLGQTQIARYDQLDLSANPVISILSGAPGTGPTGYPSAFRGTRALPPIGATVNEKLPAMEENGFILADFTPDGVTIRYFSWLPARGAAALDTLEPLLQTELTI